MEETKEKVARYCLEEDPYYISRLLQNINKLQNELLEANYGFGGDRHRIQDNIANVLFELEILQIQLDIKEGVECEVGNKWRNIPNYMISKRD